MSNSPKIVDMPLAQNTEEKPDYFVEKDGLVFAGTHLIVDLWEAHGLNDADLIEQAVKECIEVSDATLLHFHIHAFEPNGLSGVAVLSESHISFHSWPDQGYIAFDIFMCGKAKPHKCIPVLKEHFKPGSVQITDLKRGVIG